MKKIIKENITKNIILLVILFLVYNPIYDFLINSDLVKDKSSSGSILVAVSIISVIACFGAFEFTYEKINAKKRAHRLLAHSTTGLLMLIIGISLIFTSILTSFIMGKFILVDLTLILLYTAVIGYDFWDLLRIK